MENCLQFFLYTSCNFIASACVYKFDKSSVIFFSSQFKISAGMKRAQIT